MFISISEFSEERNVDRDTVNAWIRNHPEVNDFCVRRGKDKTIDTESEAYLLLEKQYPLPKPVEIVIDTKSREELVKAQQIIIHLQKQNNELQKELVLADSKKYLLEEKEKQIEKLEKFLDDAKNEVHQVKDELMQKEIELNQQLAELERVRRESAAQLEAEKNRKLSFRERLFGKK